MSSASEQAKLPLTFEALAIPQAGHPVSLEPVSITSLQEDELLVRVGYSSINKMDPGLALVNVFGFPTPYVLGFDFSGHVVKVGASLQHLHKPGDEVLGRSLVGGGFAQYVLAKGANVIPADGVPGPEASTLGIAFLTAYESLVLAGSIEQERGRWIYIAGAAGGVGHFAAQIAKLHGLKVIGSAGKASSLKLLEELTLDHIVDYSKQDVASEVMRLTEGKGVDVVYESTYTQASYVQSAAVIASGGKYIRLGTEGQLARSNAEDMRSVVEARGASMVIGDLGRYGRDPYFQAQSQKLIEGLKQGVSWYREGRLKPVITDMIPFDAKALQGAFDAFLEGTNNVGKVVVSCGLSAGAGQ